MAFAINEITIGVEGSSDQMMITKPADEPINNVIVDDTVDDDEDNIELKDKYVRILGVFFLRQRCGDMNFVNDQGKSTLEFSNCIQCIERIREIGKVFHTLDREISPSILKQCKL